MSAIMERIREDEGLGDLRQELAQLGPLSVRQRLLLRSLVWASRVVRVRAIAHDREAFAARMAPTISRDLTIQTTPGGAIDEAAGRIFAQTGVAGPFRLMSEVEAAALHRHLRAQMADDNNPILRAIRANDPSQSGRLSSKAHVLRGANAHMYDPIVRDVLMKAQVVQPLRDLMGTESVACWRSQVFQQRPGLRTTLHQNVAFPETYGHQSLSLRPGRAFRPNTNLNAWISLTRADVDNGCLVVLKGSFRDTRVYDLGNYFAQNPMAIVTCMAFFPPQTAAQMLSLLLFSTGNHRGITKLMLRLADFFHDDLFAEEVSRCDFRSKPGEFWIFSSFNMHGSLPSVSADERFTLVGRYINEEDVRVDPRIHLKLDRAVTIDPARLGWSPIVRPAV